MRLTLTTLFGSVASRVSQGPCKSFPHIFNDFALRSSRPLQQQQQHFGFAPWLARCFATEGSNPRILRFNNISDNAGAKKNRKRWGRGPGSGRGKLCGRGMKGAKSRRGGMHGKFWYEGGQTPLHRRLPKRGFSNKSFERRLHVLNLERLMEMVYYGRIDTSKKVTLKDIYDSGALRWSRTYHGIKILGGGFDTVDRPIHLEVSDCSAGAKSAIEAAGGSVRLVWFNRVTLRAHLKPHKFAILPRSDGIPPPKYRAKYAPYYVQEKKEEQKESQ